MYILSHHTLVLDTRKAGASFFLKERLRLEDRNDSQFSWVISGRRKLGTLSHTGLPVPRDAQTTGSHPHHGGTEDSDNHPLPRPSDHSQ